MTYQEALEKIAALEAQLAERNATFEKELDQRFQNSESEAVNSANSEMLAQHTKFRDGLRALEQALAPVIGTERFDEPLVISDIRRALDELKDAL